MKKIIFFTATFLICACFLPKAVFGIGMVAEPLIIKDILRDQEVSAVVSLLNSSNEEATYKLVMEGEMRDWASFYQEDGLETLITKIKVPPASYLDVFVKFHVPKDTPNGEYKGAIVVLTVPEVDSEESQNQVTIVQRVDRQVLITVTDEEILKFRTGVIPLEYGVAKDEPLQIKIIYTNQGNVLVEPDVQLKITKSGKTIFNAIFPYPENENPVRPLEKKIVPLIEWPTAGQNNGRYTAEVNILLDGKTMHEDDFDFQVGFDVNRFLNYISRLGGGNLVLGWFMIGGFFIMLSMMLTFAGRKKGFWERMRRMW